MLQSDTHHHLSSY